MKNDCFDEGTIQAFLDGELASDSLENAARHFALCGDCAAHLAAAEDETAFAFSALEQEFNSLVPTHRLWSKINDSIESERNSFWNAVSAFFRNPAIATFATFLIVCGVFVFYLNSTKNSPTDFASASKSVERPAVAVSVPVTASNTDVIEPEPSTENNTKGFKSINAKFDMNRQKIYSAAVQSDAPKTPPAAYQFLPGEESYIKTIATLEKTVDESKNEVLRPSSRVAYEKDLALVNNAIRNMQTEVRKNPKNASAQQVLLDSYQNKIDLLNSVAGKTELMASLR